VAGLACLVLLGVTTALLFVWPATDHPVPADAVVVLGGDGRRQAMGERLVRSGVAPVLAISIGSPYDPCYRRHEPFQVICFIPSPRTTQGESRWLSDTARAKGWRNVVVVASYPQATRARLRIRRCYHLGLEVVAVHVGLRRTVADSVYEWGAMLKALTLQRSC
jgi:uncharacterized SAM-binding protein YcdF (DUF218 family)